MSTTRGPSSAIKTLSLIAVVLAVFSLAANGYAVVETPYRRDTLRLLAYGAFGTGVLAAVFGLVSGIKRAPVGWLALLGGAAGAAWQFSWAV